MWKIIGRGAYQCSVCNIAINGPRRATELPACKICIRKGNATQGTMVKTGIVLPSATELAKNYLKERKKWVEAGKPVRTDGRILQIYNDKCEPCDFRREGRCGLCGCFVKPKGTIFNKIAWGTTKCAFWRSPFWTEETDPNNLRNATQEEIDAFNEEETEEAVQQDIEHITKELVTEDNTMEEATKIIEEQQEEAKNNPPPPKKKKGCGCG